MQKSKEMDGKSLGYSNNNNNNNERFKGGLMRGLT